MSDRDEEEPTIGQVIQSLIPAQGDVGYVRDGGMTYRIENHGTISFSVQPTDQKEDGQ